MADPLEALKHAQGIGPDPLLAQAKHGEMPLGPLAGLAAGWRPALKALLGWRQKSVPGASGSVLWASSRPAQETLGETLAEFTPVGGEELYNVARRYVKPITEPAEAAYERLKRMGGR